MSRYVWDVEIINDGIDEGNEKFRALLRTPTNAILGERDRTNVQIVNLKNGKGRFPWQQGSWGQHEAHLGPTGPRWPPCWPHELCYLGWLDRQIQILELISFDHLTVGLSRVWFPSWPINFVKCLCGMMFHYWDRFLDCCPSVRRAVSHGGLFILWDSKLTHCGLVMPYMVTEIWVNIAMFKWFTISKVHWHSFEYYFARDTSAINH